MSFADQTWPPADLAEIKRWVAQAEKFKAPASAELELALDQLNSHLTTRTTMLGTQPSEADRAVYQAVAPLVRLWTPDQRTGKHSRPHVVRHMDFLQNSALFGLNVSDENKVQVDPDDIRYVKPVVDAKAEKERLKKEKAAVAAAAATGTPETPSVLPDRTKAPSDSKSGSSATISATQEKVAHVKEKVVAVVKGQSSEDQKKERVAKQAKAPAAAAPLSPGLIDLRVGHILKAIKHPEADSLYVSTIAMGDTAGEETTEFEGQTCRTVCSGLNGLIPLEEMQGRRVVVVANLKPVKMRGIKSCAMVLAASPRAVEGQLDDHSGPVELVNPPASSKAGERVFFEGWRGEPESQLNPKKKVWETLQPGFTTTKTLEVAFDAGIVKELGKEGLGRLVTESGGVCTVPSLQLAQVR